MGNGKKPFYPFHNIKKTNMKNIVYLVTQLINSGPENVVLNICKCLDRSVFNPVVFSLRGKPSVNSIEAEFEKLNINIHYFGFSTYQLEFQTKRVSKKVEDEFYSVKGDILHVHCYHPNLIASYLKQVPTIATIHQISGEDFLMKKGNYLGRYMKWRFDRTLSSIDKVVVISDYMSDYYKRMATNLTKIPNGVLLNQSHTEVDSLKAKFNVETAVPIILVTGALSSRKNVVYIINELRESKEDFTCIILGEGDKRNECEAAIDGDTRFRLEGFKSNVSDYLAIADLYISASKSEGLPMSVLEALNMGVPCVLSDIPPHVEIANNMNVDGVLCYSFCPGGLKACFEDSTKWRKNKGEIEKKAKSLYSSETMTKMYERVYSETV